MEHTRPRQDTSTHDAPLPAHYSVLAAHLAAERGVAAAPAAKLVAQRAEGQVLAAARHAAQRRQPRGRELHPAGEGVRARHGERRRRRHGRRRRRRCHAEGSGRLELVLELELVPELELVRAGVDVGVAEH